MSSNEQNRSPAVAKTQQLLSIETLDPTQVASELATFGDDELEVTIAITDNAAMVNRLARIERGRRHENRQGERSDLLVTPGLTSSERTRRSEERTVAEWYDSHDQPTDQVAKDGWKKLVQRARQTKREDERETKRQEAKSLPPEKRYRSHVTDIAQLHHKVLGPVDVIITDPPYPREYLWTFAELSRQANALLKPGGLCVVMSGQSYLPEVYEAMGSHLDYYWTGAYLLPGQPTPLRQRNVNTSWKPLLVYANGRAEPRIFGDVMRSDRNEKEWHDWGQSISGMLDVVDRLTEPGDLVLDPFVGGGATAVAALELDRSVVVADNDAEQVRLSDYRVGEWFEQA